MPLADTSFIVDLMRRDHGALSCYREFEEQGTMLLTTGISALELYKGAFVSKNSNNLTKVKTILELFIVLPVDETIYEAFGRMSAGLYMQGNPIGDFDEVIAAIALCNDGSIITRDHHFEKIPGLKVIAY